jgi:hypothetical protein
VVKYERITVDEAAGTFAFTGDVGLAADVLEGQILTAPCDAGVCNVRKDTTLMPPGYATTVRMRTSNKPGLFVWHW